VFAYLDYRSFLADWFDARKLANPRYSHRLFARRAGHSSPSLLLLVIRGQRNLTERTTAGFAKAMGLDREQARFFRLLVDLDQARTGTERNRAWSRISATRTYRNAHRVEDGAYRYLTHWFYPAIRELAACEGFVNDPAWVARTLRPKITVAQAREALASLFELGLLEIAADGEIRPTEATVVTPHEIAGLAAMNYHRAMLGRAVEALESVSAHERHLGAVTVAIPFERVAELKAEVAAFQERMLDLCDGFEQPADQVFQFNLQLFPLSVRED
jgi:uncharacterized protein (TIGR02147 family)